MIIGAALAGLRIGARAAVWFGPLSNASTALGPTLGHWRELGSLGLSQLRSALSRLPSKRALFVLAEEPPSLRDNYEPPMANRFPIFPSTPAKTHHGLVATARLEYGLPKGWEHEIDDEGELPESRDGQRE